MIGQHLVELFQPLGIEFFYGPSYFSMDLLPSL